MLNHSSATNLADPKLRSGGFKIRSDGFTTSASGNIGRSWYICCMKIKRRRPNQLAKRAKRGFRGYPVATVAFYGPTAERASKVVIGIIEREGAEPEIERWYSQESDVRHDDEIGHEIVRFITTHGVLSVVMTDRIIGCPHEEGVDYPDGEACPECPYWRGRDRWTGETIN